MAEFPVKIVLEADIDKFARELEERISRITAPVAKNVSGVGTILKGKEAGEDTAGGLFNVLTGGGVGSAGGGDVGGALAGGTGTLAAITIIAEGIMKIKDYLVQKGSEYSGYFKSALKLSDMMFGLALKPIADAVGMVLVPVQRALLRQFIIPWNRWATNVLKGMEIMNTVESILEGIGKSIDELTSTTGGYSISQLFEDLGEYGEKISEIFGDLTVSIDESGSGLKVEFGNLAEILSQGIEMLKEGFDGIADELGAIVVSFTEQNDSVVDVFSNILDGFDDITDKFSKKGSGLLDVFDDVVSGLANVSKDISSIKFDVSVEKLVSNLNSALSTIGTTMTVTGGANIGEYQTGGYVHETGIYRLHKGEYVEPAWSRGRKAESVVINVNVNNPSLSSSVDVYSLAYDVGEIIAQKLSERRLVD